MSGLVSFISIQCHCPLTINLPSVHWLVWVVLIWLIGFRPGNLVRNWSKIGIQIGFEIGIWTSQNWRWSSPEIDNWIDQIWYENSLAIGFQIGLHLVDQNLESEFPWNWYSTWLTKIWCQFGIQIGWNWRLNASKLIFKFTSNWLVSWQNKLESKLKSKLPKIDD